MLKIPRTWNRPEVVRNLTISDLVGQTIIQINETGRYQDQLEFILEDGRAFVWYHEQDCCESVSIEDITGDLDDLTGSPILRAEERTNRGDADYTSQTWTFYEFATIKGSVTVRWLGESNGYYSESVDLCVLTKEEVDNQTD